MSIKYQCRPRRESLELNKSLLKKAAFPQKKVSGKFLIKNIPAHQAKKLSINSSGANDNLPTAINEAEKDTKMVHSFIE